MTNLSIALNFAQAAMIALLSIVPPSTDILREYVDCLEINKLYDEKKIKNVSVLLNDARMSVNGYSYYAYK